MDRASSMKLYLDSTQRLNLHALMGAQRASVDEVRIWWRLQDLIALDEKEKEKIEYRIGQIGGVDQPMWNPSKRLPSLEYEFTPDEFERIARIVREWQAGYTANDRGWLEPLLKQLEPLETKVNGGEISAPHKAPVQPRHRA